MNKQIIKFFIFILMAISASCTSDNHENVSQSVSEREPLIVTTRQAGSQSTNGMNIWSGQIQSKNKATVSAQMMGYVTSLNIEVGDHVTQGQKLLTIKNNELPAKRAQADAGIAEAKAALKNTTINYERMKALWEQESITRKEWDDISAQYTMMKAKVEGANSMRREIDEIIALTNVFAPISGFIASKMIEKGDLVNPGVPLMTIEGDGGYEVVTNVSDAKIPFIKKGMTLECEIKSSGKRIEAVVREISPSAIHTAGQFTVKALLKLNENDSKTIFPGMYANVYAQLPVDQSEADDAILTVDKSALIQRGQLSGIYTISGQGTAVLRWVRLGNDFGDEVEVVSGLSAGEEYIISEVAQLVDGIRVQK